MPLSTYMPQKYMHIESTKLKPIDDVVFSKECINNTKKCIIPCRPTCRWMSLQNLTLNLTEDGFKEKEPVRL